MVRGDGERQARFVTRRQGFGSIAFASWFQSSGTTWLPRVTLLADPAAWLGAADPNPADVLQIVPLSWNDVQIHAK